MKAAQPTKGNGAAPPFGSRDLQRWHRIGLLVIAAFFGTSVVWSAFVPLASAVLAQGQVKVDSNRKRIQHLDGGVVREILVRDGDRVTTDQVLVRLDETRASAAYDVLRDGYWDALAQQARLVAERDERNEVEYPEQILSSNDEKATQIVEAQNALFSARRTSLRGEVEIIDRTIAALTSEIEGLTAQQNAKEEQIASLRAEYTGLTQLLESGLVERTRVRAIERDIAELEGARGEHVSQIASIRASVGQKELEKFQIRKAFHEAVVSELREVQSDTFDLAEREGASRYVLAQTELRAPVDGTVVDVRVHTSGGVVAPGEILMEVVPLDDRLMIEARVSPESIDRVQEGLPAAVKLHAFNRQRTPELNGEVVYVAADTMQDDKTGAVYYTLRVEVSDAEVKRLGDQRVQPGMLADVFVRTGERTFLGYLFTPLADSFDKAWLER